MMRLILFILLLSLLFSCNVKKQFSRSTSDQSFSHTYETIDTDEKDLKKTSRLDESVITRTGSGFFVEIVPRGTFRISPDGSFEGEASHLRIHRRDTTHTEEDRQLDQEESDQSRSGSSVSEALKDSSSDIQEEKEVSRSPNFFVWIGVALGILVLIIGLRFILK